MNRLRERGSAIVLVMWVVIIATVLLVGMTQRSMMGLSLGRSEVERVRAHWLARGGVEKALCVLATDIDEGDSLQDLWFDDKEQFVQEYEGVGSFKVHYLDYSDGGLVERYGALDLASRLNVNAANVEMIAMCPGSDEVIAASILDWRDSDSRTRGSGAENGYYGEMDLPYSARNKAFESDGEVMLIQGVDKGNYFGRFKSVSHRRQLLYQITSEIGSIDDAQDLGLAYWLTAYGKRNAKSDDGSQQIYNINSVSENDLQNSLNLSKELAKAIVEKRGNNGFESLFDLLDVEVKSDSKEKPQQGKINEVSIGWIAENFESLTISDEDEIYTGLNINTASSYLLNCLPEIDSRAVDQIVSFRDSSEGPFVDMKQLLDVVGDDVFRDIAEFVVTQSQTFEVTCTAETLQGVRRQITVVVERDNDKVKIIYWHQSET
ncbi:general secretion pathway protein GspK [Planctomycetota bacterium]|nr:general secretion pathway protein GspK [Planctomycetota bacterium]